MENKIIVLGSILAASAVTIVLCMMGKKKEEVKSNVTGRSKKNYIDRDGNVIPSNRIYGNGTNCGDDDVVDVGGIGQPSDYRCKTKLVRASTTNILN